MEISVKSEIYFYLRGVESLTELQRVIVKDLTHGNCFLFLDEPNQDDLINASRIRAEQDAYEMIQRNLGAIPSRVKRDL